MTTREERDKARLAAYRKAKGKPYRDDVNGFFNMEDPSSWTAEGSQYHGPAPQTWEQLDRLNALISQNNKNISQEQWDRERRPLVEALRSLGQQWRDAIAPQYSSERPDPGRPPETWQLESDPSRYAPPGLLDMQRAYARQWDIQAFDVGDPGAAIPWNVQALTKGRPTGPVHQVGSYDYKSGNPRMSENVVDLRPGMFSPLTTYEALMNGPIAPDIQKVLDRFRRYGYY